MRALLICLPALAALAACSERNPPPDRKAEDAAVDGVEVALADLDQPMPGLWEHRMSGGPAGETNGGFAVRTCVGPSKPGENPFQPPAEASTDCTTDSVKRVASGLVFKSVCKVGADQITTAGTVTGDLKTNYRIALTMTSTATPQAQHMQMSAKRLGDCPAGVQPGALVP